MDKTESEKMLISRLKNNEVKASKENPWVIFSAEEVAKNSAVELIHFAYFLNIIDVKKMNELKERYGNGA